MISTDYLHKVPFSDSNPLVEKNPVSTTLFHSLVASSISYTVAGVFQMSDVVGFDIKPAEDASLMHMLEYGLNKHLDKYVHRGSSHSARYMSSHACVILCTHV